MQLSALIGYVGIAITVLGLGLFVFLLFPGRKTATEDASPAAATTLI